MAAGDLLRLALDEVAAARQVDQRARNQHRDQSAGADHRQPPDLLPVTAHMHAQTCCSARVHGCQFSKEPHGGGGGERCA